MKKTPMRRLRDHLKMTQAELAATIGMHPSRISQSEGGESLGGKAVLKLFSKYPRQLRKLRLTERDFLRGAE